jgi:hypothetical protein
VTRFWGRFARIYSKSECKSKSGTAEIIRRFVLGRISHHECVIALDAVDVGFMFSESSLAPSSELFVSFDVTKRNEYGVTDHCNNRHHEQENPEMLDDGTGDVLGVR